MFQGGEGTLISFLEERKESRRTVDRLKWEEKNQEANFSSGEGGGKPKFCRIFHPKST